VAMRRVRRTRLESSSCDWSLGVLTAVQNGGAGGVLRRLNLAAHMRAAW
jgi:hypothetical protein